MNYQQLEILLGFLRAVAQEHGTVEAACVCGYIGLPTRVLRTPVVVIKAIQDSPMLEIERVENGNPVVMVNAEGKIIRTHGELRYVHDALLEILAPHGITADVLARHGIVL